jgi:hypothetical protein
VGDHSLSRAELRWVAQLPRLGGIRGRIQACGTEVAFGDAIAAIRRVPSPPSRRLRDVHAALRIVGREMRLLLLDVGDRGADVDVNALTAAGAAYREAVERLPLEPEE